MGITAGGRIAHAQFVLWVAEEHGGGKIELLKKGAYKDMDVVVMLVRHS